MNKQVIIGLILLLVMVSVFFVFQPKRGLSELDTNRENSIEDSSLLKTTDTQELSENQETKDQTVPLPSEEDIIRLYFSLINEHRISEAVAMMTENINNDDAKKQGWGVMLNAFKSVQVLSIEPSMKEDWTDTIHTYKVELNTAMSPNSANEPIPYYGFDSNPSTRWISIEKNSDEIWKIMGIATGP